MLWSDPVLEPGLFENEARGGVGCVFGPDATEAFLRAHGLALVIRSHEGPDARRERPDMGPMDDGFTVDHDTPSEGACGEEGLRQTGGREGVMVAPPFAFGDREEPLWEATGRGAHTPLTHTPLTLIQPARTPKH